ncbi:MAG: O-antigen ligase family protein [Defluviitaleaceae bacterium]|nr:O-antigen ligase family protein [Defluviitaleaceae bacterium]
MVTDIKNKCILWMDGSLFFRGIIGFFNILIRFFEGSFLVRLFVADYDKDRLRHSCFVRIIEGVLNIFPKFSIPIPQSRFNTTLLGRLLQGSALWRFFTGVMGLSLPAYGLLAVVIGAPFLPTMMVAGMIVLVFGLSLFHFNFKLDLTSMPLLLFMVITLFSGFTSAAASYSVLIAILTIAMMSSYLLAKVCLTSRKRVDFVIAAFIIAAAGTALVAFYQVYTGYMDASWVDRNLFAALSMRVFSTFANPNVYGTYLLLAIPLAAVCILYAKNIWYKLFAAGITGLLLIALGLTYSRGGYVALAGAVFFFLILIEKRLIVLFVAGVAAMPFILPTSIIARVVSIVNFADSSTMYRIAIWQASLRMLGDFWMSGIGQGAEAYNAVYPFYAFSGVTALHSHNLYLQIFLETGIVGFLVFLAILACFFRTQFSFMRHTSDQRRKLLSAAMVAAVVGFLMQGVFDHSFHNYRVMLVFYLFLGIANCITEVEETDT